MGDPAGHPALPKPDELLALDGVTAELFETLREWFDVGSHVTLDLTTIDSAVAELGDPQMIAAMAMRKLQALNLLATPGVRTSTDVVVAIVQDLDRALLQAPSMALSVKASSTDWDRELADLAGGVDPTGGTDRRAGSDAPATAGARSVGSEPADGDYDTADRDFDAAVVRFRDLHRSVHRALEAVIRDSEGEIRYFE